MSAILQWYYAVLAASKTASAFSPLDVPGLTAWYDFSDITTLFQDAARTVPVTADGDVIGGVTNKAGNFSHLAQAVTAAQPLYKTAIKNGLSVSRFDGSDDSLHNDSVSWPLTAQTSFAVFDYSGALGFQRIFTQDKSAGNDYDAGGYIPILRDSTTDAISSFAGGAVRSSISLAQNTFGIFASLHSGASLTNYLNDSPGTPYSHSLSLAVAKIAIARVTTGTLGANQGFLTGNVAEVIVYDTALSTENRQLLQNYLNTKWAVY